jgi:hypothetical protein
MNGSTSVRVAFDNDKLAASIKLAGNRTDT